MCFISILQQMQHRLTVRGIARIIGSIPTPAGFFLGPLRLVVTEKPCQRPLPPASLAPNSVDISARLQHLFKANMHGTHGKGTSHCLQSSRRLLCSRCHGRCACVEHRLMIGTIVIYALDLKLLKLGSALSREPKQEFQECFKSCGA